MSVHLASGIPFHQSDDDPEDKCSWMIGHHESPGNLVAEQMIH
jgi:hypothetical protein